MVDETPFPKADARDAVARLVVAPLSLIQGPSASPPGIRMLCGLVADCPGLGLHDGEEVVVVLSPGGPDLPADLLKELKRAAEEDEDADYEGFLAFEGCSEAGEDDDLKVVVARSWHGRRPSREAAEAAVAEFLAAELGEEDVPFELHEDGDEDSAPNKCGWSFWVLSEDTTSYLKENLEVEWYGTGWAHEEPGSAVP